MSSLIGQCLCGAVRFTSAVPPLAVLICHCEDCRRQSGSAFSVNALLPEDQYVQIGITKSIAGIGESGNRVDRYFCGDCGSPIATRAATLPGMVAIKVGTLDNPDVLPPAQEIYCRSAFSWLPDLVMNARSNGAPASSG